MDIPLTATIVIPSSELTWSFSRSSGPGGQAVNTADTRVTLSWNLAESTALPDVLHERALGRIGQDTITVTVQRHRSQLRNRQEAVEKLAEVVRAAIAPPRRSRRATKPTATARAERLSAKRRRSDLKTKRARPDRSGESA
jgi:ribosome-associated protein